MRVCLDLKSSLSQIPCRRDVCVIKQTSRGILLIVRFWVWSDKKRWRPRRRVCQLFLRLWHVSCLQGKTQLSTAATPSDFTSQRGRRTCFLSVCARRSLLVLYFLCNTGAFQHTNNQERRGSLSFSLSYQPSRCDCMSGNWLQSDYSSNYFYQRYWIHFLCTFYIVYLKIILR